MLLYKLLLVSMGQAFIDLNTNYDVPNPSIPSTPGKNNISVASNRSLPNFKVYPSGNLYSLFNAHVSKANFLSYLVFALTKQNFSFISLIDSKSAELFNAYPLILSNLLKYSVTCLPAILILSI